MGAVRSPLDDARALCQLWLERHLQRYAPRYQKPTWSDLYVHRREVDAWLIDTGTARSDEPKLTGTALDTLAEREAELRAELAERAAESPTTLDELADAFGATDPLLVDALRVLLLAEVEPEFARSMCHAWCDFTKKQPDVGFLVELLARTNDDQERLAGAFARLEHPLFRLGIIEVDVTPPQTTSLPRPLVHRPVRLAERPRDWLLGLTAPPVEAPWALSTEERSLESVLVADEARAQLTAAFRRGLAGAHVLVHGPPGSGRRSICQAAANAVGRPVLTLELPPEPGPHDNRGALIAFFREARLQRAVPVITEAQHLENTARLDALSQALAAHAGPLFFTATQRPSALLVKFPGIAEVRMPHPTPEQQRRLWLAALPDAVFSDTFTVDDLVQRYALTGGAIQQIAQSLDVPKRRGRALQLTPAVVLPAIRDHLGHRLGSVANAVLRGFAWSDLVVPEKTATGLKELVSFVRNRDKITGDWGFGRKLAYGRGVACLFFGPPGTGKTMAASIMGTELAMEVFQIDLSRIVDKYIGETEKNLGRVFDEGARAQAILLFDEADSLFGKRTQVTSSVDRYANLEVNFLLQRVETYDGICILTSNNPDHIDDAFKRRIRFKVEFPFPNAAERERLFRSMMPPEAPLGRDVSFAELAARFEVPGAHVKNIILRGAAMAAAEAGVMTMDVLCRAGNREYVEMGKLVRD